MRTNKILATLLVFALVVTLVAPSFAFAAAPLDDVTDAAQVAAITKLNALEVLVGDGDGTFRPNDSLTRAEFAVIAVKLSGNAKLADIFAGKSSFSDVAADAWYAGWVEAAYASGYVMGVGDGKFAPDSKITYEQALTVLMRILGYKDDKLPGNWPGNFIVKGNSLGLLVDGFQAGDALIDRGMMAVLTSKASDQKVVTYDKDGKEELGTNTLLADKFKDQTDTYRLKDIDLENNTVAFVSLEDHVSAVGPTALDKAFSATGVAGLQGHKVTIVTNDDGKVVAIADAQPANEMITGSAGTGATVTTVKVAGTTRNVSAGAFVYKNGEAAIPNDVSLVAENDNVKLFYADKEKTSAIFVVYENFIKNNFVTKIGEANSEGAFEVTYTEVKGTGQVANQTVKVNKATEINLNGKAATAADLKKDIVFDVVIKSGVALKINASDKTVNGKVVKLVKDKNDVPTVTIDGADYAAVNKHVTAVLDTNNVYTLYLNNAGKIVKATQEEGTASDFVGIVLAVEGYIGENDKGKLDDLIEVTALTKDGNLVSAILTENKVTSASSIRGKQTAIANFSGGSANLFDVMKFNLDKGKVVTVSAIAGSTVPGDVFATTVGAVGAALKSDSTLVKVNGTNYPLKGDVVVFDLTAVGGKVKTANKLADVDVTKVDPAKAKIGSKADIKKSSKVIVYLDATGFVTHIVVFNDGTDDETQVAPLYGVFKKYYSEKEGDTTNHYVDLNTVNRVLVANAGISGTAVGTLVALADASTIDGKYDSWTVTEKVYTTTTTNTAIINSSDVIVATFTSDGNYVVTSDTKYYKVKMDGAKIDSITSAVKGDVNSAAALTDIAVVAMIDKDNNVITTPSGKVAAVVIIRK